MMRFSARHIRSMVLVAFVSGVVPPLGLALIGGSIWAQPVQAQDIAAQVARLNELTLLAGTLEVVVLEGVAQGRELGADLLGNPEDPAWLQALARVYDGARIRQTYDLALSKALMADPRLVDEVAPFLSSPLGARILALEVESRRTLMDEAAKTAAGEVFARIKAEDPDRLALLERLVVAADMIESNVMSGLNGNLAFLKAMAAADPEAAGQTDEQALLSLVWENEPDIRANVIDFLYPAMALAYGPLKDDDLAAYVGFSESPAGQRLARVLTLAFDEVMQDLAEQLGAEAGRAMSGQVL